MPYLLASSPGFHPLTTDPLLFVLAGVALLVAMLALSNQEGRLYSASVIYVLFGVVVAVVVDLAGVRWLDPLRDAVLIEHASELAVIVALFATGLALERPVGLRRWAATWRLLGIVMPLSIFAVAGLAYALMGLSIGAAIVLAAALSPTDPVLAGDLGVGPPGEPDDEEPRFALTSEAGLNDGLAFPFVMLGLLVAGRQGDEQWLQPWLLGDLLWAITGGLVIGAGVGLGMGRLYLTWREREHVRDSADAWVAIAAVLAVYGLTEALDAYGFVAAFSAGVAFNHAHGLGGGRSRMDAELDRRIHRGASAAEKIGELALVMLVGTLLSTGGLGLPGVAGWCIIALLILVIRPVATQLGFLGSRVEPRDRWFIGWFGVRGIGSLYYATFAAGSGVLPDQEARIVLWTVLGGVVVSIVAHGMTGEAAIRRLRAADDSSSGRSGPVSSPAPDAARTRA